MGLGAVNRPARAGTGGSRTRGMAFPHERGNAPTLPKPYLREFYCTNCGNQVAGIEGTILQCVHCTWTFRAK